MNSRTARALALLAALVALYVTSSSPVQIQAHLSSSGPWLDRFNAWRASVGLSLLTEDATWSAGDYDHAVYMVKNNLISHSETVGTPYYTAAGNTAAQDSNIYVSSTTATTDAAAIDWWMQAPFHAMAMMDPRLSQTGFGSYREARSGWQMAAAVDVVRGNSFSGGTYPVYFPGNGSTEPLRTFGGGEFPDPLRACSGYAAPTGLPVFIEVGGNVATTVGPDHTITGNGVSLENCVIDSSNATLGSYLKARGGVILIPRAPLQTGVTYRVALTVNAVPHTWSFTVGALAAVVTTPCTTITASPAPVAPAVAGTAVLITAGSTGCPDPRYRFWVRTPGGAWTIAQDYSAANTFNWTATSRGGSYSLEVDARDATESVSYDVVDNFTYAITGCSAVSLGVSPASPLTPGPNVILTATSTCATTPTYRFWMRDASGAWSIKQDYGPSSTYTWATKGLSWGSYGLEVDVRSLGSTDVYQAVSNTTVRLGVAPCSSATLAASPASGATGSPVVFTASSSSCSNPNYRFWVRSPGASWAIAHDYAASSTFTWSGSVQAGTYAIEADVRDSAESVSYDAVSNISYVVAGCSGVTLSATPAGTAPHGTLITLTAAATCPGTPNYKFWIKAGAGAWTVVQNFGASSGYLWTPTAAGPYYLEVDVRDQGSAATYEKVFNLIYQVG